MATSIQKQLAAIAANSNNQLNLKAQRAAHGKSLLFDPKIAVNQSFDTLYHICLEGFQEVCMLDRRFAVFATTLFSEQSKNEEREQMTAGENKELDAVLESFMALVGSRLLLRPAVKAMEWLVRRFQVHEYNTQALLLTFLPYHGAPIFPTLLSILPAQLPQPFRFLHPYVGPRSNPPRSVIVYTASHTPAFFAAFSQYMLKVVQNGYQSTTQVTFWSTVLTQAVDNMLGQARSGRGAIQSQREEDLLTKVLPVLEGALNARDPEMSLGCYMIITVLVSKTNLDDRVLDGLMQAVASTVPTDAVRECLLCLSVISHQRHAAALPAAVVRALLQIDGLSQALAALNNEHRVDRLILGLILGALDRIGAKAVKKSSESSASSFLLDIIAQDQIEAEHLPLVVDAILKTINRGRSSSTTSVDVKESTVEVLRLLLASPVSGSEVQLLVQEKHVDLEALELEAYIAPKAIQAGENGSEDMELPDASDEPVEETFEDLLSAIRNRSDADISFLVPSPPDTYEQLRGSFLRAVASQPLLSKFKAVSALKQDEALTSPLYFSFYMRILCDSVPARAKATAITQITGCLNAQTDTAIDLQALVPFLIFALREPSGTVRRAAINCLVAIASRYYVRSTDSKVPKNIAVWGKDALYGTETKDLKWLSSDDSQKILTTVFLPAQAECVLHEDQVAHVLDAALNGLQEAKAHGVKSTIPELKSSRRAELFSFLGSHIVHTPSFTMRFRLLGMLAGIGKAGSAGRVHILLPLLKRWAALGNESVVDILEKEKLDLQAFEEASLTVATQRDAEGLNLVQAIASGNVGGGRLPLQRAAFARLKALWPKIKDNLRQSVAEYLLHMRLDSSDAERQDMAADVLNNITLTEDVLLTFLESASSTAKMPNGPPSSKRRRTSRSSTGKVDVHAEEDLTTRIHRLTRVLELVQSSKPESMPQLMGSLFHVLGDLQQYKTQMHSDMPYLQTLTLGSLLAIVDALKALKTSKGDFPGVRMDLLVDCVRSSPSPQVQSLALLLISSLATWAPELVLHSVMPIFTFMSTTLLHQSDEYSAHVIDQTITKVVPPLAAALRKQNQTLASGAAELLLSFATAFEHIPISRRLGLFKLLVQTLGPDDCLYAIIAMLLERYPTDTLALQFTADLVDGFDSITGLTASSKMMSLLSDAVQPKRALSDVVLGLADKPTTQRDTVVANILTGFEQMLSDNRFRTKLAMEVESDEESATRIRQSYATLLDQVIRFPSKLDEALSARINQTQSKLLSTVLRLLPTSDFVGSADLLLQDDSLETRTIVLKSLDQRVRIEKQDNEASRQALIGFLPRLTQIIQGQNDASLKLRAIASIDQIALKYGKKHKNAVVSVSQVMTSDDVLHDLDARIRVATVLCLASMVEILRDDFIPLLPKVLNHTFDCLRQSISPEDSHNERLHNAGYALLHACLEYVPFVMIGKFLDQALEISVHSAQADMGDLADENRTHLYQLCAKQMEAKDLFASLQRTWDVAAKAGYKPLKELVSLWNLAMSRYPKSAIARNSQSLFNLFYKAFDLRRVREIEGLQELFTEDQLEELETSIDEVAIAMTLKLNDTTFRPFFIRLVEWAASLPKKDTTGRHLRYTTLFHFTQALFDRLKSIVTSYSSHLLDPIATLLNTVTYTSRANTTLLTSIFAFLAKSFQHDQDDFWQSPSHFTTIATPLLNHLSLAPLQLATSTLIPTITDLATAAASPEHHKTINTSILKLLRHENPQTRLAAVKAQISLTERLAEDWLGMLAEMLPFISEAQEDEEEVVEREVQRWIGVIEGVYGESLEAMLQ